MEARLPVRKREAFAEISGRFPGLKYKNFGTLAQANRQGRLPENVAAAADQYEQEINALVREAAECRKESERLLDERRRNDTRKLLDPQVDVIPAGPYPKLRECKTYPLRRDCNYGDNLTSRWNRCEYMKYDNAKSAFNPMRWVCTAPE
jgi:hypothetical protein